MQPVTLFSLLIRAGAVAGAVFYILAACNLAGALAHVDAIVRGAL